MILLQLSFRPTSAGLFFGQVMSSVKANSAVLVPLSYGVGTALPVLAFAALIAFSAQSVGKAYNVPLKIEWWARTITGILFLLVGVYFSLKHIFEINLSRL